MARKRGFFAEIHHQNQVRARRQMQAVAAANRASAAAQREHQRLLRELDRAQKQSDKADAAARRAAEAEATRLRQEAGEADAQARNAQLQEARDELAGILAAAVGVDHRVDMAGLRQVAEHPSFARSDLETPTPAPRPLTARDEPVFQEPPEPKGLGGLLGGKKKHSEAVARAREAFSAQHAEWEAEVAALPLAQLRQMQEHQRAESARVEQLEAARAQYAAECTGRDAEAARANASLDQWIEGLRMGAPEAVEEWVGMVLGNSYYPEGFPVEHDYSYDSAEKELVLTASVPPPSSMPTEKEFKYHRPSGELRATALSAKELKDAYTSAIYQVSLRMLHEIFSADEIGNIRSIALTVQTETTSPATGRMEKFVFIAVAADRERFGEFDLSHVTPLATLMHLGAAVSKSPYDLVPIDPGKGVRDA
ncbi:MAG: hypothetical protein JO198_12815 [Candidatus Dormibacteraeota bacterium]|nr:hypothetical protein [Candidatus Dormibacteraeota bacterium]